MSTLIFDIETIGENFNDLDETTQHALTRWIERESITHDEYEKRLEDIKNGLGFSPFTGEIVAIGVLDHGKNKGVVYYQNPDNSNSSFEEGGMSFKSMSEAEMLEHFWQGVKKYDNFVSFNGRGFDVPFLMIRSAIHKIKASKDLMYNRYLNYQKNNAKHIDLMDQLIFYSAVHKKPNLHIVCRAFGIPSPKAQGVTGDDVKELFDQKQYLDIAKYNVGDLKATQALYNYWQEYLNLD
ncbi:MAG: ribonuclease H-like domain-containing protein [Patescibacteria group bacterium]|nr:ribonuclease H-like domain-containing protein [Patescibacteria group bacterium]